MFAQDLLIIFLILLAMLTAIDPMLSAGGKKKKSRGGTRTPGVMSESEPLLPVGSSR
jgi:hypothetical protein